MVSRHRGIFAQIAIPQSPYGRDVSNSEGPFCRRYVQELLKLEGNC
jgi:hypothetical protein